MAQAQDSAPPPRRRRWSRRLSLALIGLVLLLLALAAGAIRWLDTAAGHRFIVARIAGMEPASGLRIQLDGIDGSVFKQMRLRNVRISDPEGQFARIDRADVKWYPLAWLVNRIDIDSLHVNSSELARLPHLKSTGQSKSILPDFDLRILDLRVDRLALGKAVSGSPHVVQATGQVDIRSRRAVIELDARDQAGADTVRLSLDSRPDDGRFDIDAVATAPEGGIIAGLAGFQQPMALAIRGEGDWAHWKGRLVAQRKDERAANIAIEARNGLFTLHGPLASLGPLAVLGEGESMLDAQLRLENRLLSGTASLKRPGLTVSADGGVDLARSRFDNLRVNADAPSLARLSKGLSGRNASLKARLSGPFDTAGIEILGTLAELRQGNVAVTGVTLRSEGRLTGDGGAWPVSLEVGAIRTGAAAFDARLRRIKAQGMVKLQDGTLQLADTHIRGSGLSGNLSGHIVPGTGALALDLKAGMDRLELSGLGQLDLSAGVKLARPANGSLGLSGDVRAVMLRLDNGFLRGLGGGLPTLSSGLTLGRGGQLKLSGLVLTAPALSLTGEGYRAGDGSLHVVARGEHRSYGPLELALDGNITRPRVDVTLARPGQGMRLGDVHLLLDPTDAGYAMTGSGQSALGPFTLDATVLMPAGEDARIVIDALRVDNVLAKGSLVPVTGGVTGQVALSGPATGSIDFKMTDGVQHLSLDADLGGANFNGPLRLMVNRGKVQAEIGLNPGAVSIDGSVQASGVRYGSLRIGRLTGKAQLVNGEGNVAFSARAQNGRAFDLSAKADVKPSRIALTLSGTIDREPIRMTAPAILRQEGDGWRLETARLSLRNGALRLGAFIGAESTHVDARMTRIPLSLLDLANSELGLGGTADGTLVYDLPRGGVPTGNVSLRVHGLTRSGLALSSSPIDLGVNGVLTDQRGAVRAIISEGGTVIGRAQALLTPFGPGSLTDRLNNAPLQAEVSYNGNADTLWRLTNIELLSLGGRVNIAARARGTLAQPQISGTVSAVDASLQSPATGMALSHVSASGAFDGAELHLDNLSGETAGNGKVTGTARFTFSSESGIGMDVRLDAKRAVLLDRDDVGATVTGPIRIRSTGGAGTISGDLDVVASRFTLGRASAVAQIPQIRLIEINRAGEEIEPTRTAEPWRLDFKAKASRGLMVEGLGMTSEWSAVLQIAGTVTNPTFRGTAQLIDGTYDFAGKRFDLREGRLTFTGSSPVNPTLDIRAVADVSDLNATISVTGTSLRPIVTMSSIPAMPQDELLARLLFGTSITNLSAPEAIQLASAVAAFQGGDAGLDPINALRRATGLSRLRIVAADATTGQKTALAAGKNIGRLYVELISDGQGYSATRVEFEITRWLSLLSSVSTIGRQTVGARISKDY